MQNTDMQKNRNLEYYICLRDHRPVKVKAPIPQELSGKVWKLVDINGFSAAIKNAKGLLLESDSKYKYHYDKALRTFYVCPASEKKETVFATFLNAEFEELKERRNEPDMPLKIFEEIIYGALNKDGLEKGYTSVTSAVSSWRRHEVRSPANWNQFLPLSEISLLENTRQAFRKFYDDFIECQSCAGNLSVFDNSYSHERFLWMTHQLFPRFEGMEASSQELKNLKEQTRKEIANIDSLLEKDKIQNEERYKATVKKEVLVMQYEVLDFLFPKMDKEWVFVLDNAAFGTQKKVSEICTEQNRAYYVDNNVLTSLPAELRNLEKLPNELVNEHYIMHGVTLDLLQRYVIMQNQNLTRTEQVYLFRKVEEEMFKRKFAMDFHLDTSDRGALDKKVRQTISKIRRNDVDNTYGFKPGTFYDLLETNFSLELVCLSNPLSAPYLKRVNKMYEASKTSDNSFDLTRKQRRKVKVQARKLANRLSNFQTKILLSDELKNDDVFDEKGIFLPQKFLSQVIDTVNTRPFFDVFYSVENIYDAIRPYNIDLKVIENALGAKLAHQMQTYFLKVTGTENPIIKKGNIDYLPERRLLNAGRNTLFDIF